MKYLGQYFLIFLCLGGLAQKPEQIYSHARFERPTAYYREQAAAWKKEIEKNAKNPNAWYNYYYAHRNLSFRDSTQLKSPHEWNEFFAKLLADMEKNIPESYEYNLCRWMIGGFDMSQLSYLKKAAALGENRTEHLDHMVNIYELDRQLAERDKYLLKRFDAGLFSSGIVYYNYNVLAGLKPGAILLTSGDNDTYPAWYLQAKGVRTDVAIVNLSLIMLDDYRHKIFAELGVENKTRLLTQNKDATRADYHEFKSGIVKQIASNSKGRPVYLALTSACHPIYSDSVQDKLYLTGLAYLYSTVNEDNVAQLKKNMEQKYSLDYLDKAFYKELSPEMVRTINENYVVPMLTLYDHYKLAGDTQKQEWIKSRLLLVSKNTDSESEVNKHLQEP